jgi:hypothetical protein
VNHTLRLILLAGLASALAVAGPVNVQIFNNFVDNGTSLTLSSPACGFTADNVQFGASQGGFDWHPCGGLSVFGAEFTGLIDVASAGSKTFSLASDDGSYLFIDGVLVVNNGGTHAVVQVSGSANLAAGLHSFTVQFFEDLGGPSGVDLTVPTDVTFAGAGTPEPSAGLLVGAGLALLAWTGRRRRTSR